MKYKRSVKTHFKFTLAGIKSSLPFRKKNTFLRCIYKKLKRGLKEDELKTSDTFDRIVNKLSSEYIWKSCSNEEFNDVSDLSIVIKKLFKEPLSNIDKVINDIRKTIDQMEGDFVIRSSAYEKYFCDILNWQCHNHRYYDAIGNDICIEMKKGINMMWFDMVRYSEIYLKIGTQNTYTIFIQYAKNKKKVQEIYIIPTDRIIKFLKLDEKKAQFCIDMFKDQYRGLNMQASATKKDLRDMASHVIKAKTPPTTH